MAAKQCRVLLLLALLPRPAPAAPSVLQTSGGPVLGEERVGWDARLELSVEYTAYTSIPYGRPPVDGLRFLPPLPAIPWARPDQLRLPEDRHCVQLPVTDDLATGDEDCLLLNIYTPTSPAARAGPLPVLVWMHGGAFVFGSKASYGPVFWMVHDLVVVTINYRLGPLGFLTLGVETAPGNAGLWDQRLALQWVQANIHLFGGDPDMVTLAGQSAGSFSATYHLFSPGSKGLFRRVLGQSGAGGFAPAYHHFSGEQAARYGRQAAASLSCGPPLHPTEQEMADCLRRRPAGLLQTLDLPLELMSQPVVDGDFALPSLPAFLPKDPRDAMDQGDYMTDVDLLMGVNSEEGQLITQFLQALPFLYPMWALQWDTVGPYVLFARHHAEVTDLDRLLAEEVLSYYVGGREGFVESNRPNITNMISDSTFLFGVEDFLARHAEHKTGAAFQYLNTYKGLNHVILAPGLENEDMEGNGHGDELYMEWEPYNDWHFCKFRNLTNGEEESDLSNCRELPARDSDVSITLTTLWSNFVRTGDPTPPHCPLLARASCRVGVNWRERDVESNEYLLLDTEPRMERSAEYSRRVDFWRSVVERMDGWRTNYVY